MCEMRIRNFGTVSNRFKKNFFRTGGAKMPAKPIPQGFHSVTPHLICRNAKKAIDFYQKAFGAEKLRTHLMPDGSVMHAELKIGSSIVMLGEEFPDWKVLSPESLGGSGVVLHIYTDDVDALFQKAVNAGCTTLMPVMDQFWGDRYGQVTDPFGHRWSIATHIEDVPEEEMERRGVEAMKKMSKPPEK
jgi:PhnB protein